MGEAVEEFDQGQQRIGLSQEDNSAFSCLTLIAFDGISMYLKMSFILLMLILGKKIV
jgi:hypothetical protein